MTKICVMGLGYIGLPTASMFATHGCDVLGVDVNPAVVNVVNRGEIHIREPGLKTLVKAATLSDKLRASTQPETADVFVIAVPTPCVNKPDGTKGADLDAVRASTVAICPVLKQHDLVILESTSPPGTTRDVIAPIIASGTDLRPGADVHIAHCPERVLPGKILRELIENDRVIGGLTPQCARRAAELYRMFVAGDCLLTDSTTAEMVKLMENTYRDVNIALANELALISEHLGIDAYDVITLANRHPRVQLHQPGPGVGGHCISVDPWFVYESAPELARLICLSRNVNDARPEQVSHALSALLNGLDGKHIAVFGVAYKGNVDDVRESPITELIEHLEEGGAKVRVYDPHVREYLHELHGLDQALDSADAVVTGAAHDEFRYLDPKVVADKMSGRVVYDGVNVLNKEKWVEAGFEYRKVGGN